MSNAREDKKEYTLSTDDIAFCKQLEEVLAQTRTEMQAAKNADVVKTIHNQKALILHPDKIESHFTESKPATEAEQITATIARLKLHTNKIALAFEKLQTLRKKFQANLNDFSSDDDVQILTSTEYPNRPQQNTGSNNSSSTSHTLLTPPIFKHALLESKNFTESRRIYNAAFGSISLDTLNSLTGTHFNDKADSFWQRSFNDYHTIDDIATEYHEILAFFDLIQLSPHPDNFKTVIQALIEKIVKDHVVTLHEINDFENYFEYLQSKNFLLNFQPLYESERQPVMQETCERIDRIIADCKTDLRAHTKDRLLVKYAKHTRICERINSRFNTFENAAYPSIIFDNLYGPDAKNTLQDTQFLITYAGNNVYVMHYKIASDIISCAVKFNPAAQEYQHLNADEVKSNANESGFYLDTHKLPSELLTHLATKIISDTGFELSSENLLLPTTAQALRCDSSCVFVSPKHIEPLKQANTQGQDQFNSRTKPLLALFRFPMSDSLKNIKNTISSNLQDNQSAVVYLGRMVFALVKKMRERTDTHYFWYHKESKRCYVYNEVGRTEPINEPETIQRDQFDSDCIAAIQAYISQTEFLSNSAVITPARIDLSQFSLFNFLHSSSIPESVLNGILNQYQGTASTAIRLSNQAEKKSQPDENKIADPIFPTRKRYVTYDFDGSLCKSNRLINPANRAEAFVKATSVEFDFIMDQLSDAEKEALRTELQQTDFQIALSDTANKLLEILFSDGLKRIIGDRKQQQNLFAYQDVAPIILTHNPYPRLIFYYLKNILDLDENFLNRVRIISVNDKMSAINELIAEYDGYAPYISFDDDMTVLAQFREQLKDTFVLQAHNLKDSPHISTAETHLNRVSELMQPKQPQVIVDLEALNYNLDDDKRKNQEKASRPQSSDSDSESGDDNAPGEQTSDSESDDDSAPGEKVSDAESSDSDDNIAEGESRSDSDGNGKHPATAPDNSDALSDGGYDIFNSITGRFEKSPTGVPPVSLPQTTMQSDPATMDAMIGQVLDELDAEDAERTRNTTAILDEVLNDLDAERNKSLEQLNTMRAQYGLSPLEAQNIKQSPTMSFFTITGLTLEEQLARLASPTPPPLPLLALNILRNSRTAETKKQPSKFEKERDEYHGHHLGDLEKDHHALTNLQRGEHILIKAGTIGNTKAYYLAIRLYSPEEKRHVTVFFSVSEVAERWRVNYQTACYYKDENKMIESNKRKYECLSFTGAEQLDVSFITLDGCVQKIKDAHFAHIDQLVRDIPAPKKDSRNSEFDTLKQQHEYMQGQRCHEGESKTDDSNKKSHKDEIFSLAALAFAAEKEARQTHAFKNPPKVKPKEQKQAPAAEPASHTKTATTKRQPSLLRVATYEPENGAEPRPASALAMADSGSPPYTLFSGRVGQKPAGDIQDPKGFVFRCTPSASGYSSE